MNSLRIPILTLALTLTTLAATPASQPTPLPPTKENYLKLAAQIESSLQNDDLKKFFPASLDPNGGFFENFSESWTHITTNPRGNPAPDTTRSVVYQSRLTWLAAQAALRYPNEAESYLKIVRHGTDFLAQKQWDPDKGGFWWSVDTSGKPILADDKHIYGNAFAIYALAAAYQATKDQPDLDLAKKAFAWLETHAHDPENGGYFEQLNADGLHATTNVGTGRPANLPDHLGAQPGQKSMNAHIHILEALTALLEVWPDDLVKKRTEEVYQIALTKIAADPGYLRLFFAADWTPAPGRDSYGHDIETAFLFAEAAAALGKPDDPLCWTTSRKIVDHCLKVAYDSGGSLNSEGTIDGTGSIDKSRVWWVQAESLNALLLMHQHFGKDTPIYWNAFVQQWNFIRDHQIDPTNGGWYNQLNPDNTPLRSKLQKSDAWTEGYHQGRAMLNVTERLKALATN